ncbi:MAG: replicative DNA helicase [Pirellulaceae bacterium]|jgi:replicative DNA helicase|nr:replicative DNA helicase [Pirellulaceae bacterium]
MAGRENAQEVLDRRLPYDQDAEQGVLGSILLMPEACDEVSLILRPDDFFDEANRCLFTHMREMHDAGGKIDVTLLVDRLKTAGHYETVGGGAYLYKISQAVPNAAHARYYAGIVREKSTLRALITASTEILRQAYDQRQDSRQLVSAAEQQIFSIVDQRAASSVNSIRDILHIAMDRLDARMRGEQTQDAVDTGFTDLDRLMGGLHNSELVILAARPSMGKTAFAMNIAEYVTVELRRPTLFVSLEMSSVELADRLLCSAAQVDGHRLRNGTLANTDKLRLVEKAGEISLAPLFVDDSPSRTVSEIAAAARRIKRREGGLALIAIDYLQLIEPDNPDDSRQEQVARIARRLKGLAREMKVPVLCLAQLNRQAEDTRDHRPRLSHLRESGAIEQDADVVMFVHREEYYLRGEEQKEHEGTAEIIISKQRNGPVGEVELRWEKKFTRFQNLAPERLQEFDNYNAEVTAGSF